MNTPTNRFTFDRSIPMRDVEATLRLAFLAAECLHGEDRVRLETEVDVDLFKHICVIDTATDVGRTLAALFGGYVRREFGDDRVRVERAENATGNLVGAT